ncbi:MAG: molybdate ABC transporter substrate-binding protein [Ginsengibacter sp.]
MRRINLGMFVLFASVLLVSCNAAENKNKEGDNGTGKLNIAVAANMQFAMQEISKTFTTKTGITCDLVISSSGKLTAQIKQGAPYDLFVSADMKYPSELFTTGFATNQPKIYAYGKLVLWSMIDTIKPSIDLLKDPGIKHIAVADPKTAPYGEAAIEVLKHYGIFENVKDKLVYGESISQTNQFITSKSAEIGFTAKSVVLSPAMKNKGQWTDVEEASYPAIAQGVIMIKQKAGQQNNAEKFYNFLFSDDAKKILENFGYSVNGINS